MNNNAYVENASENMNSAHIIINSNQSNNPNFKKYFLCKCFNFITDVFSECCINIAGKTM